MTQIRERAGGTRRAETSVEMIITQAVYIKEARTEWKACCVNQMKIGR